jgi:TolA-binding protein
MHLATPRAAFVICLLLWALCAGRLPAQEAADNYRLGAGFYDREQYKLAAEKLRAFLNESPTAPQAEAARFMLGHSLVKLEQFQPAREAFRRYLAEHARAKRARAARYWVAHCSYYLEDYKAAEVDLLAFVEKPAKDEYFEHALPILADCQLHLNKPREALANFRQSIEQFPKGARAADAQFGVAQCLEQLKEFDAAIEAYKQILADPGHEHAAEARFNLGALYFSQKQFKEALEEFALYERQHPRGAHLAQSQLNAGFAHYSLADYERAAAQFQKLRAAGGSVAQEAGLWLGLSYKRLNDLPRAAKIFSEVYEAAGEEPRAEQLLYHWADCEMGQQKYQRASELLAKQLERWPAGQLAEEGLHAAALCAVNQGDLQQAEKLVARYDASFARGKLRLRQAILKGRIKVARGELAESQQESESIWNDAALLFESVAATTEIESTRNQARYYLGDVLLRLGRYDGVLEATAPLAQEPQDLRKLAEFPGVFIHRAEARLELARAMARQETGAEEAAAKRAHCAAAVTEARRYIQGWPSGALVPRAQRVVAVAQALAGLKAESQTALAALRQGAPQSAELDQALLEVADIAYAREDFAMAESLFAELTTRPKESRSYARALADLGWSRFRQKKHAEAVAAFRRLIKELPGHPLVPEMAFMVGEALAEAGQRDQARQAFAEAFALPETTEKVFQAGRRAARLAAEAQDAAQTDALFDQILKRFSSHAMADQVLDDWATFHYVRQDYKRADQLFARLVAEYPSSARADNARLILAESALFEKETPAPKRFEAARAAFTELAHGAAVSPHVAERAMYQLMNVEEEAHNWKELARACEAYENRFPQGTYLDDARFKHAAADYMQDNFAAAASRLAALRERRGEPGLAAKEWFPLTFVRNAEALFRQKDYDGLKTVVEEFERWNPKHPLLYQAWEVLGRGYKNQAQWELARELFARVIRDPHGRKTETAAKAQLFLADTWFQQEQYQQALEQFLIVDIEYKYPEWQAAALFQAARCQEQLQDLKGAEKTYARLLKLFPESTYAPQARGYQQEIRKLLSGGAAR